LGFSEILSILGMFYKFIPSCIKVNAKSGNPFTLPCLVQQGCLFLPFLFVFTTDVFGYLLGSLIHDVGELTFSGGN
jgi:hypothetical protein